MEIFVLPGCEGGDPAAFRTREIDFTNRLRRYFFHFVFAEGEDTIELARQTGGSRLLTASDRLVQGTGDSSVPRPLTADLERSLEAIRVDYEVGGHMSYIPHFEWRIRSQLRVQFGRIRAWPDVLRR
ncbi:MAG: hypothetical protein M5U30_02255 [Burkholderiaceae bacterium]|nr:hypothetical protein [Burkholderiaceae bacterium]